MRTHGHTNAAAPWEALRRPSAWSAEAAARFLAQRLSGAPKYRNGVRDVSWDAEAVGR
jgi:hypothetical protein